MNKFSEGLKMRKFEPSLEAEFLKVYHIKAIPYLRLSLIVIMLASLPYAYLDLELLPFHYKWVWLIRFGIWIPLMSTVLFLSYRPIIEKRYQILATTVIFVIGLSVLFMIFISDKTEQAYIMYYAGLGVVMTFTIMMHVRFKATLLLTTIFSLGYLLVAIFEQQMLSSDNIDYYSVILTSNSIFLFSIMIAVSVSAYTIEQYGRNNFINNKRLSEEKLVAKEHNLLLYSQNKEIQLQKQELETNHKNILSSVNYARRIQNAMLPNVSLFEENFAEHFIYFQPRDIISGDFYWINKLNNTVLFAAADCTGHGVPGALLSMLGMSFLNELSLKHKECNAGQLLDSLRDSIKTALSQNDVRNGNLDGMDIALCVIDLDTKIMQYAGAYIPLYLKRKNEDLLIFKADRQPIGVYTEEFNFTNHTIQLKKDDIIYMFSDGLVDQFKDKTFEKFKTTRFKEILKQHTNESLQIQKIEIEKTFLDWKGEQEQIDDVLVLSVKIK